MDGGEGLLLLGDVGEVVIWDGTLVLVVCGRQRQNAKVRGG